MNRKTKDLKGQADSEDQMNRDYPGNRKGGKQSGKSPETNHMEQGSSKHKPTSESSKWEYPEETAHTKGHISNKHKGNTAKEESPGYPSPYDDEDYEDDIRGNDNLDDDDEF